MAGRWAGRLGRRGLALLMLSGLAACAGSGDGGGTAPRACTPTAPCEPAPDPASVSFRNNIQPMIFTPSCALGGCHDAVSSTQALNLSTGAAYRQLVNVRSTEQRNLKRVLPGDPDASYLVRKIENAMGITGTIMPQGCDTGVGLNGAPCLTADQIQAVRTWICACAPNN